MTATGITVFRVAEGKIAEGWVSADMRRSEEELRWLTEGGQVDEATPEDGDALFDSYSSAYDVLVRNLTWRIRAERAKERERVEQELRVAREIQQALLPQATPKLDGWQLSSCSGSHCRGVLLRRVHLRLQPRREWSPCQSIKRVARLRPPALRCSHPSHLHNCLAPLTT